jgi:hypothetical protein
VTQHEWYARSLDGAWRQFVNQEIFQIACSVVLEEASSVRTPPNSTELNALQNQFREGMFSAIRSLRMLAQARTEPMEQLSKPWDRKRKEEEDLPSGPKPHNVI